MKVSRSHIATLLSAGAAALAIAGAPNVWAAGGDQSCSDQGGSTQCERTGNVQIYAKPRDMAVTAKTVYGPFEGYHAGHN